MSKTRAERLISNCAGMDAVVIINDGSPFLDSAFWYLTGLETGCFEGSMAIVGGDGRLDIVTGLLEEEAARSGGGNVHVYSTRDERNSIVKGLLEGASNVGFNFHSATYASVEYIRKLTGAAVADAAKGISDTLSVKDAKEIRIIRKACGITSKVAEEIPDMLRTGITEKEVATMMDGRMRELGGSGNAFSTIAAFGENSSQPHYTPGNRKLRKGDVALFDFGTKYGMYCSDLTRTLFFGEPPDVLRRAYETVKEAQEAGFGMYRDGAKACEADMAARNIIDGGEFKGRFIHSFGHGIGMEVHQGISVHSKSGDILRKGNIVSAEPGIYLPGIGGIRIEDTCLIKKDGAERLTSFDRSLTVV